MAQSVSYHNGRFPPAQLDWQRLVPLIGPSNAALARYDGLLSAVPNARSILELYERRKDWIVEHTRSQHAVHALDWFFGNPIFATPDFVTSSRIPKPTASRIVKVARENGLLRVIHPARGRQPAILSFPELLEITEGRSMP